MGFKGDEPFKIDQAYWKKNKPFTLKTTGLGAVMAKYQTAKSAAQKFAARGKFESNEERANPPIETAVAILDGELKQAVEKAKKMCNPKNHKEALAFLGRYPNALKAEKVVLIQYKNAFNKKYKTLVQEPTLKKIKEVFDWYSKAKTDAHDLHKVAEGLKTEIEDILKQAKAARLPKVMQELTKSANTKLGALKKACQSLEALDKKSQEDYGNVTALKNQRSIEDEDRQKCIENEQKCRPLWAAITNYNNKGKLFLANAEANAREVVELTTGVRSDRPKLVESVKAVAEALKGWGEDARRQNNNMTQWQKTLTSMTDAQREATRTNKPIAEIAKAKSIAEKPETWKTIAQTYIANAKKIAAKTTKMKNQAEELRDKTLSKVTAVSPQMLEENDFKPLVTRINSYIKEVSDYATISNVNSILDLERLEKLMT